MQRGMWDLSSLTRDPTHACYAGSIVLSMDQQGSLYAESSYTQDCHTQLNARALQT